jgi:hypothetical protein
LVRRADPALPREEKAKAIMDALNMTKFSRHVVERTLPNLFNRKVASVWNQAFDKSASQDFGCLMAVLEPVDAASVVSWSGETFAAEDLSPSGIEHMPHVTLRYGFKPDVDIEALKSWAAKWPPIRLMLRDIMRFKGVEGGTSDCMVVEVTSPDLEEMRGSLDFKFKDSLEDSTRAYVPHLTLAYVKPGACEDLNKHSWFAGNTYVIKSLQLSTPGSKDRFIIPLNETDGTVDLPTAETDLELPTVPR